ncbi:60 kDa lysophospholipase-like isoform X2 [Scyliorhinus canicula]|uniref:60 kDa lysophospholipase-like isoform X2 n=1 Tax=Scyliorhinus canicula TaxID=7830 RepID=UPI0018F3AF9E|nr:60 kDa lysophospholipase-like isoform X2 [Scyliorhinus canicula]
MAELEKVFQSEEKNVLVIYTGGTIGMVLNSHGVYVPKPGALIKALKKMPGLHDVEYAKHHGFDKRPDTLVLPKISEFKKRIAYKIIEYSPLLDSSNMTADDWKKIANDIKKNYKKYCGFVILHGTDTMAYTASALSFICENLGKPIILTGSQIPIYEMRSDAHDNLLGALLIAGQYVIPEVSLYFHHQLYRGNRVIKVDAESFRAYLSPNLSALVNVDTEIKVNWNNILKPKTTKTFTVHTKKTDMNQNVGLLKLYPGIAVATIRAFLQPPMEGIVLETYGAGNAPDNRPDMIKEFKNADARGMLMINCTQCLWGSVITKYATGKVLTDAGFISGCDMTPEASLAKLSYVLGKTELSIQEKKKMLCENLRGEMSGKNPLQDQQQIQATDGSLAVSCMKSHEGALTPSVACLAAKAGDIDALEAILDTGNNLWHEDHDGRTPLHVAACEGHLEVVDYLLNHGATVYAKDREAAHSAEERRKAWYLTGLDLDQCSYSEQNLVEPPQGSGYRE